MSAALLLDTCAVIWAANAADAPRLRSSLREAHEAGVKVWISPITAWELGNLASTGRIGLARPTLGWFETAVAQARASLAELSPAVLVASTELPDGFHRDPADRIIVATAREYGLRLVTRDRRILDYAAKGHVMALEC